MSWPGWSLWPQPPVRGGWQGEGCASTESGGGGTGSRVLTLSQVAPGRKECVRGGVSEAGTEPQ